MRFLLSSFLAPSHFPLSYHRAFMRRRCSLHMSQIRRHKKPAPFYWCFHQFRLLRYCCCRLNIALKKRVARRSYVIGKAYQTIPFLEFYSGCIVYPPYRTLYAPHRCLEVAPGCCSYVCCFCSCCFWSCCFKSCCSRGCFFFD